MMRLDHARTSEPETKLGGVRLLYSNQPNKRNSNLFSPACLFLNWRNPTQVLSFGKQLPSRNHRILPALGHKNSWLCLWFLCPWYQQKSLGHIATELVMNSKLVSHTRPLARFEACTRWAAVGLVCAEENIAVLQNLGSESQISTLEFNVACWSAQSPACEFLV